MSGKTYVDNAMNRSLGRVGMPHGSAVHSRSSGGGGFSSSSFSSGGFSSGGIGFSSGGGYSSSPKSYVDNSMNRSLGRVGMPHGSAVHSRNSDGGSSGYISGDSVRTSSVYAASATLSSCGSYGMGSVGFISGSSSKTYVDNPMNRRLGRVGLEHGTAVQSKPNSSSTSSSSRSFSQTLGSEKKVYVDNPTNRQLNRVGLEHGTAVHSRPNSSTSSSSRSSSQMLGSEKKVYVDNPANRRLNRVGLEHGTAVHSRSDYSSTARSKSSSKTSDSDKKLYVDNAQNRKLGRVGMEHGTAVHSSCTKEYKNNALNRKLGRAGKPLGSMPYNPKKQNQPGQCLQNDDERTKVYVDNAFNRKHNRVGRPLGSCPLSKRNEVYRDNALNRALGRVGQPWGSCVVKENVRAEVLRRLRESPADEIPDDVYDDYENGDEHIRDEMDHVFEFMNREREINRWLEENTCDEFWQPDHHCDPEMLEAYADHIVPYSDLQIIEKIGHGGFGDVFIANLNKKPVAIKMLQGHFLTKKRLDQFRKEMDLFCQLDHPNIVDFIGACVEPPDLAIVMELMDGSLFDALHMERVDFTNEDKVNIMRGTVRGMAYIHGKGIAHCDLKTQNVLLNNVPNKTYYNERMPVHAKITDFGLSKMKSDMTTSTSKAPLGTPRYSAPEILRGEFLDVTQLMKADMYSFGLVILELAVEEIAFEDFNLEQLRVHVGQKGHMPPMPDNLRLNSQLYQGLKACWNFKPNSRPAATDMIRTTDRVTELIAH